MAEPLDSYCDSFLVALGPYGATLSFRLSPSHPDPTTPTPPATVANIRTSIEHAKVMVMVMKRHIQTFEQQMGIQVPVSSQVLGQLGIAPEDWSTFWKNKP